MNRKSVQTFVTNLSYFSTAPGSLAALNCRECEAPLDIHQPNSNQPEEFLGTCSECGVWYRIEPSGAEGQLIVLQLPSVREIKANQPDSTTGP